MNIKIAAAGGVASLLFLAGCSSDSDGAAEETTAAAPSEAMSEEAVAEVGTIVDVAAANEDFETLVAAVTAADLGATLSSEGPFTVFAPTDDAFEALPEGLLAALLLPENKDALTEILTYHVVAGEVTSDQVEAGDVTTVQGEDITITTDDGAVELNGTATVTAVDVEASNGVIHVIDGVLVPPSVDVDSLL
ncbi:MAG: fasciclin domain-containing protein [Actinomycetota bacterium]|nr:fasciclin domain-containing protein [Actinomycetota bacterium]